MHVAECFFSEQCLCVVRWVQYSQTATSQAAYSPPSSDCCLSLNVHQFHVLASRMFGVYRNIVMNTFCQSRIDEVPQCFK